MDWQTGSGSHYVTSQKRGLKGLEELVLDNAAGYGLQIGDENLSRPLAEACTKGDKGEAEGICWWETLSRWHSLDIRGDRRSTYIEH